MRCTYTDDVGEKIAQAIRAGLPVKFAAAKAGVGLRTLYDWLARGEADDPPESDAPLVAFAETYRLAEAEYAAEELAKIDASTGEDGDWKRLSWKLERRFPREFGSKAALELSGPEGGPIEANVAARVVVLPQVHDPAERDDSVAPEPGAADGVSE